MNHSIYGGSKAFVWSRCHASAYLTRLIKDEPGPDALLGTQLHQEAEECLRNGTDSNNEIVQSYINAIRQLVTATGGKLEVEKHVAIDAHVFGTIDALIVADDKVFIIDLKTGHKSVNARNNEQLMWYAYLYGCNPHNTVIGIHQYWKQEGLQLTPIDVTVYHEFVDRCMGAMTRSDFVVGDHCASCNAFGQCREAVPNVDMVKEGPLLTPAEIAEKWKTIPLLESWIKKLDASMTRAVEDGAVPGFRMVPGKKKPLTWIGEVPEQFKTLQALTPTQTIKAKLATEGELVGGGLAMRNESEWVVTEDAS